MNKSKLLPSAIAMALATVVSVPGMAASLANSRLTTGQATVNGHVEHIQRDAMGRTLYIVLLKAPPAALYHGTAVEIAGLPKIPVRRGSNGKLDLQSAQAKTYVDYLSGNQSQFVGRLQSSGMAVQPVASYQYALNGFTAWMSDADAKRVAGMPEVRLVRRAGENELDTDRGPALIGAPKLWFANSQATEDTLFMNGFEESPPGNRGEGVVIGDIDSGINFDSHAFDDPDPSGFSITNPLGSGNFLGWCNPNYDPGGGQVAPDPCSNKIIGSYDFVHSLVVGVPDTYDPPGAEDEGGHGTHTASTAAGDTHLVNYLGNMLTISGVAPHANLIAYDACYLKPSTGQGLCPYVATSQSAEQAVRDGVVDALNYSIGGGTDPWGEPTSMAFLSAVDSGIFVAASAGNSGPGYGTTGHQEPWVTTVAASTHDRSAFYWFLLPQGGSPVQMWLGSAGATPTSELPAGTQLVLSPDFNATNTSGTDGCSAYTANTFQDAIALISRGGCSFSIKAANAVAAGAITVVISNNQDGTAGLAPSGTTPVAVPVFGTTQNSGLALETLLSGGPVDANYTYPALAFPQTPDVVASFSSRGPASLNLLKPDVAAPGVNILAAVNGGPDALDVYNGTSMAAPHTTGSAALIRNAHPNWTPMEIKSALMLTAKPANQMLQPDETTPAIPLDAGSGRIQVDQAAKAGLVMRESGIAMLNADPANGGDPSQLNLASLYNDHCTGQCDFSRSMTGALASSQQWDVSTNIDAPLTVSAPASFTALPGSSVPLNVSVDASNATSAGFYFGQVTLTANGNPDTPVLHMPIAVAVPPPAITVTPGNLAFTINSGASDNADLTIGNDGGVQLSWSVQTGTGQSYSPVDQPGNGNNGYRSTEFTPVQDSVYQADDFLAGASATLTTLAADGFQLPGVGTLSTKANTVTFTVYADASGSPAGIPNGGGAAPVYTCTLPVSGAGSNGLSFGGDYGDGVSLDTATAAGNGCPAVPVVASGTYWLTVYPGYTTDSSGPSWYMFEATRGSGGEPMVVSPTQGLSNWSTIPDAYGDPAIPGYAITVNATIDCGAPWLLPATTAGQVNAGNTGTLNVTVDGSSLSAGSYSANLCLANNDPDRPLVVVPVNVTVN